MTQTADLQIERKRFLDVFSLQAQVGPYEELPIILPHIDPQLHLSKNEHTQPFYLICEKDTILVGLSGDARIEFKGVSVNWQRLLPGDFCYVPGGTPHRIVPSIPSLHLRYKALKPGREGVAWYCERCGAVRHRIEWECGKTVPQEGYARSCAAYAERIEGTPCTSCGLEAPPLDLHGVRWLEVAAALHREADAAAEKASEDA